VIHPVTALPNRACPVVLAAPSGTGKTSIARSLVESGPEFVFSVSATTRPMRPGEQDGKDYHFMDEASFQAMIRRGELCEWAGVHGYFYGTPGRNLDEARGRGEYAVLDIDVQGARQIRASVPDALLIFLLPPSAQVLARRLTGRATEGPEQMAERLRNAVGELEAAGVFDYVVVNDDLKGAVRQVKEIVRAERHRTSRALDLAGDVGRLKEDIERMLVERTGSRT